MDIKTDSPRVRLSRKMVLEFLGSSVDLSTAPQAQTYAAQYGAAPSATAHRNRRQERRSATRARRDITTHLTGVSPRRLPNP